jgi:hypothetical protein
MAVARIFAAVGRSHLVFPVIGRIHPRYKTPAVRCDAAARIAGSGAAHPTGRSSPAALLRPSAYLVRQPAVPAPAGRPLVCSLAPPPSSRTSALLARCAQRAAAGDPHCAAGAAERTSHAGEEGGALAAGAAARGTRALTYHASALARPGSARQPGQPTRLPPPPAKGGRACGSGAAPCSSAFRTEDCRSLLWEPPTPSLPGQSGVSRHAVCLWHGARGPRPRFQAPLLRHRQRWPRAVLSQKHPAALPRHSGTALYLAPICLRPCARPDPRLPLLSSSSDIACRHPRPARSRRASACCAAR